jgi:hypothetical protein
VAEWVALKVFCLIGSENGHGGGCWLGRGEKNAGWRSRDLSGAEEIFFLFYSFQITFNIL